MKRYIAVFAALALAFGALPVAGQGSGYLGALRIKNAVTANVTADDTDVAIVVKFIGANPSANDTVEVAVTTSDITFKENGAASTDFECPVSAPLGGIIDVSDAACNTLGEVVDAINSGSKWRAFILDGVRTDSADGKLLTLSATDATATAGVAINFDTSTAFLTSRALVACRTFDCYVPGGNKIPVNPYLNTITSIKFFSEATTYATGTSTVSVLSVKPGGLLDSSSRTETVTTIYTAAGGATTATLVKDASTFGSDGLLTQKDSKLILRVVNSTAMSAVAVYGYGLVFSY